MSDNKNQRPSVLVVTGLFPTPGTHSFSGTFVVQQIQALHRYYRVVVLVPYVVRPRLVLRALVSRRHTRSHGLDVYRLPCLPMPLVRPYLSWRISILTRRSWASHVDRDILCGLLKRYLSTRIVSLAEHLHLRYQFVLVHGHELFIGDEAATIGRRLGIPSIVTIHARHEFHESSWGRTAMQMIIENLRSADYLLTVSQNARRTYTTLIDRPIHVISNGYTPPPPHSVAPPAVRAFVRGRKVALYVGFLIDSKRVDLLLRTTQVLCDELGPLFCLLIVGVGPARRALEGFVRAHGLEGQVRFVGEVHPSQMPAYYTLAGLLVQPSVSDSFSMACLEAMAHGRPIICTSNVGIAEYIRDGVEGFVVPPDDLEELTTRLRMLLTDDSQRRQMGQRALERAADFAWDVKIHEIVDFYHQAMENVPRT